MSGRTNDQRAERALETLRAYKELGQEGGAPDCQGDVADLLTDLHHYMMKYLHNYQAKLPAPRDASAPEAMEAMNDLWLSALGHFEHEVQEEGFTQAAKDTSDANQ